MRIRNIADLGAQIRERRTQLGLDQASLAKAAGTSRKWLMEMERGKPGAAVGLVLRTLQALNLAVELTAQADGKVARIAPKAKAINSLLDSLKGRP